MTPRTKKFLHNLLIGLLLFISAAAYALYENYQRHNIKTAHKNAAKAQMSFFGMGIELFKKDIGRYPTEEEGLQSLFVNSHNILGWKGPYLMRTLPPDGWGNVYIYRYPGKETPYEIISYGADGRAGGKGENEDIIFMPGREWEK
jgi:general secretion pathway protein G